jgi:uncharacterized membrane protein YjgN (DUF898 family)
MVFKRFRGFKPEAIEAIFNGQPRPQPSADERAAELAKLYSRTGESQTGRPLELQFTAETWEYFRLWVVCQLLFVLTLGFYGPWGRTRKARFLAQHWKLDGESFQLELQPMALLKGRLVLLIFIFSFAAFGIWNPWLQPLLVLVTFAAAPWILSRSFAFRWRTLSYRGIAFNAKHHAAPLQSALWLVGLFSALAILPLSLLQKTLGLNIQSALFVTLFSLLLFPAIYLWPRATAALTHYRFAQASWGAQAFDLAASAKEIFTQTWKAAWSGWSLLLGLVYVVLFVIAIASKNRDIQAVMMGLGYVLLTTFGITFARSRRLNFVLNRLTIGGLRILSLMHPSRGSFLTMGYALLAIVTLGLSIPWSTVHYNRWRAQHVSLYLEGDWSQFIEAQAPQGQPAFAVMDALGNALDIEIGI